MQSRSNVVISCGGGTPMRECNVVEMKKNGRVVLLTAKPETILDLSLIHIFEGPLDLLLHLIEKNKIDIYDIPSVEITDQYM